jgi:hypothetical protein
VTPASLHVYDVPESFIIVIADLNRDMPVRAPTHAKIMPERLLGLGISLQEIIVRLRGNLYGPAHLLRARWPDCGENHALEFEDLLDGERFRLRWGAVCEPFGADLARDVS